VATWLIGLIVAGVCLFAGRWQLERLDHRRAFNATLTAQLSAPVVAADRLLPVGGKATTEQEWRRVEYTGSYDLANQILIRGRYFEGRYGYEVVTPLVRDGLGLLVDRGWVPAGASATDVPDVPAPPAGTVTVIGRVRAQDTNLGPQGAIIGLPTRAANLIDPEAIASELPYPALAGYVELIEQIPGQQSPRPRQAPELSEGPHLAYAVQWFFFALLALVAPAVFLRRSEGA
jgi:cytochrome oxidase assembly protein ShyY1